MKKIFAFMLALLVTFSCFSGDVAYAAETEQETNVVYFNGKTYDVTAVVNKEVMAGFGVTNYKYVCLPYSYNSNSGVMAKLYVVDADKIKNLVFLFNDRGSSSEFEYYSGDYVVNWQVLAEYKDGGFKTGTSEGVYHTTVNIKSSGMTSDSSLRALTYDVSSSMIFNAKKVCSFTGQDYDNSITPISYMDSWMSGTCSVKSCDIVDDEYVLGQKVFFKALPILNTKLGKAMRTVEMSEVLSQVKVVLPILMVCLVGFVGLRKALALLLRVLRQA